MRQKINVSVICLLAVGLILTSGCKRTGFLEPSPLGPSTYAIILSVSASPNVLFAGDSRENTTITATLKKFDGIPLTNKGIQFHVRNVLGERADVGYFDGGDSVATRFTDSNGRVNLTYHGPVAEELTLDTELLIYAIMVGEGKDIISEYTPVIIIRDVTEIAFEITADPNVLWCTSKRPQSLVEVYLKKTNGSPLSGRRVYFYLDGEGSFEDGKTKTFKTTDANGYAKIYYIGPTLSELNIDKMIYITGQAETTSPFYINEEIFIRLIRGSD
jgi:hypothetical protein